MKNWRNPYLIVRSDGIGLLDPANNEQHVLKTDEVLDTLANLPLSAWPYGRVVAVQEPSIKAGDDETSIRRNRALLQGTLIQAKILINWVPA